MDQEQRLIGRSGHIPVYDGETWLVFRNAVTIHLGVENCADPMKVDVLRQNVVNLLDHYPDTIEQLEKLGIRVRALLNRRIRTSEDVVAWAESMFNLGPMSKLPDHVQDTVDLAYDDIVIEVKRGREPFYVIPAAPRGSGVVETIDFTWPGAKRRYGPRHEFTKLAFVHQIPKKVRYRGKTEPGEPLRPRGRPRKDGLVPGSPEAKQADKEKQRDKEKRKAARGTITPIRPPRIRLSRRADREATG